MRRIWEAFNRFALVVQTIALDKTIEHRHEHGKLWLFGWVGFWSLTAITNIYFYWLPKKLEDEGKLKKPRK